MEFHTFVMISEKKAHPASQQHVVVLKDLSDKNELQYTHTGHQQHKQHIQQPLVEV